MTRATFIPKNEINVRELFAQRATRLGYRILESRAAFPDYVLERDGQKLFAEAEFRTSDFLRHRHDLGRCDLILVWEHDVGYMPIPVLELKSGATHATRCRRGPRGRAGRPRGGAREWGARGGRNGSHEPRATPARRPSRLTRQCRAFVLSE